MNVIFIQSLPGQTGTWDPSARPPINTSRIFLARVSADGLQTYSQPLKKCIFLGGRGGGKFLKKYSDQLFLANQAILRTFVFLKKFFFFGGGVNIKRRKNCWSIF